MNYKRLRKLLRAAFLLLFTRIIYVTASLRHNKFERSLEEPDAVQTKALKRIVRDISRTEYGRNYRIKWDDSYQEFSKKLPIVTYDMLSSWLERQIKTSEPILVNEKISFYEKTSGSSGAFKLIPFTKSHLESFHQMFLLWLYDLLRHGPKFCTGKIFLSLTLHSNSLFLSDNSQESVKIGLEKDQEYLPVWLQVLFQTFWILPAKATKLRTAENFKRVASLYLLSAEDLEIILIWSPSFLTNLLDYIEKNKDILIEDLSIGCITLDGLKFKFKKSSQGRLSLLKDKQSILWSALWPSLKFISCWDNALAHSSANFLRETFPQTLVQGKGLLTTEGPLTFPLISSGGFVPLVDYPFFEFEDDEGRLFRLHELTQGKEYQIIISIRGGFTRYRIGDVVRVTHFYRKTPCLEFIGRAGLVSDLVGEKLTEVFVRNAIQKLSLSGSRFQVLVPVLDEKRSYYTLLVDHLSVDHAVCAEQLDCLLQESFMYRSARIVGQLDKVRIKVNPLAESLYLDYFFKAGMKLGNVKHRYLLNKPMEGITV